ENISGNLYLGAVSAYNENIVGLGKNQLTGERQSFPDMAKAYHQANQAWAVVGDENMGEGSSREHAAMEPRFRGARLILARSFARIHETNLKKQGIIPLTFSDPGDYDRIEEDDRLGTQGLADLAPGKSLTVTVTKPDGSTWTFEGNHTFGDDQIEWFKAGSALAVIRQEVEGGA
ncbi:MAG: aconitate hydratase, partial [Actinomycetia bacterium]|nr:aconitate hydratase [Actinomycetes bacterium]